AACRGFPEDGVLSAGAKAGRAEASGAESSRATHAQTVAGLSLDSLAQASVQHERLAGIAGIRIGRPGHGFDLAILRGFAVANETEILEPPAAPARWRLAVR